MLFSQCLPLSACETIDTNEKGCEGVARGSRSHICQCCQFQRLVQTAVRDAIIRSFLEGFLLGEDKTASTQPGHGRK